MQFISTLKPMPVGKTIVIFTDHPEPVGDKINFTDSNGVPFNVARITHVGLSSERNVNNGRKYFVQAEVEEQVSPEPDSPLATRVYWT